MEADLQLVEPRRCAMKIAGITLIAASLVAMFGILHHPTHAEHEQDNRPIADILEEMQSQQLINTLVHGTMIVIVGLFVFSTSYLTELLGFDRASVRAAMIVYLFGGSCMVIAAAVNGFISPSVMGKLSAAATLDKASIDAIGGLLSEINRIAALTGVVGMSLGVLLWSIGMLQQTNPWRLAGVIGLCVGGIGVIGILSGQLRATVPGMIFFVATQSAWNIAVGKRLLSPHRRHDELRFRSAT